MFNDMTVSKLSELIKNKEACCTQITNYYLDRIKRFDKKVESFITVCEENAINKALELDSRNSSENKDKLFGIPFAAKDNICTKGITTTCGSKMLGNFVPPYSATVIDRLNNSILLGKLNMDEFGMGSSCENSYFKKTKNPFDLSCVPGGSSGGVAAAVAAGFIPFALASDTGGSVRQPASFCGCVGLKPTYGRVSRYGLIAYASSLDQIGIITKNVSDAALVLESIAGYDLKDTTTVKEKCDFEIDGNIKGIRIGILNEYFENEISREVKDKILNCINLLEKIGTKCEQCTALDANKALSAYYIIASAEASSNFARYDGIKYGFKINGDSIDDSYLKTRSEGFGTEVKRRIMLGNYVLSAGFKDDYYQKACMQREEIKESFDKCFEKYDVLITPTTLKTAFTFGEKSSPKQMYMSDLCTVPVNLAGLPAVSIPCGIDKNGLPIGIQIIAKRFDEKSLLNVAYALEQELNLNLKSSI